MNMMCTKMSFFNGFAIAGTHTSKRELNSQQRENLVPEGLMWQCEAIQT